MEKQDIKNAVSSYANDDTNKILTLMFIDNFDDFWSKNNLYGHLTASCWVVNSTKDKVLLTHHLKLKKWFQLGGHIEVSDIDIFEACVREFVEESGLKKYKVLKKEIFDIDIHKIPTNKQTPEHFHFDIRILIEADENEKINFDSSESRSVEWVEIQNIQNFSKDESILRMLTKTKQL